MPTQSVFSPDSETTLTVLQQKTLFWIQWSISAALLISALVALLALAANNRRWQRRAQHALFWAFVIQTGFCCFYAALPGEGGVGGFLLLLALPVLLGLTITAFFAARAVQA